MLRSEPARELIIVEHLDDYDGRSFAVLGEHIRVKPSAIARYCLRSHRPITEDLSVLVESVALADRMFTRRRSEGWSRSIHLRLPVYEQSTFSASLAVQTLTEVLTFLTGDHWSIEFVQRRGIVEDHAHLDLPMPPPRFVVPYSDGLDSFSQSMLLEADHGADTVLRVRCGAAPRAKTPFNVPMLNIPRRFGPGSRREQSYRSRPFVYFTMAAIASVVAGAEKVVVGESGQGAIGAALLPFAGEWPFRSNHPAFLARLAAFLQAIYGQAIIIEPAQVWRTKGEVLLELIQKGLVSGITETHSCSLDPRHRNGFDACGVCGGCLLRAVAMHSAGLPPYPERKTASHASDEPTWTSSAGEARPMSRNQRDIAAHSVISMRALGQLLTTDHGLDAVRQEASVLSPAAPEMAERKLTRMLKRHNEEWSNYVNDLGPASWLRKWAA